MEGVGGSLLYLQRVSKGIITYETIFTLLVPEVGW